MNAIVFDDEKEPFVEIYSVCTLSSNRGKGVANTLFATFKKQFNYNTAWLGVDLNNSLYEVVVKLYAKQGFGSPYLTDKTVKGQPINFSVLGLTYRKGEDVDINQVVYFAITLRDEYFVKLNECSTIVKLSKELINFVKQSIYADREYGGNFLVNKYVNGHANLALKKSNIIEGLPPPKFAVNIPYSLIEWHTHPNICYQPGKATISGCYIGWPSGQDMARMIPGFFFGVRKHYIISNEGVWSIQLTPNFMVFLDGLKNSKGCVEGFTNVVRNVFSLSESARENIQNGYFVTPNIQYKLFQNYVQLSNTYTLNKLLNDHHNIKSFKKDEIQHIESCRRTSMIKGDFVLYQVVLHTWEQIEQNNGIVDRVNTLNMDHLCPLPVSQLQGDVGDYIGL